jgi:hypothetical protein
MSWIEVDYNVEKWLWMPTSWQDGPFTDHREWARQYAEAVWALADVETGDQDEIDNLALTLTMLAEDVPARFPGQDAYLYLPDPRRMPLPLYVQAFPAEGDGGRRLGEIVRAGDTEAVEPPIVEAFTTELLGDGVRSLRYFTEPDEGTLGCSVNYAWRVEEHGLDLRLWSVTGDLGRLAGALDDFDELARTVRVRHDSERDGES